jgi:hypothetical protein
VTARDLLDLIDRPLPASAHAGVEQAQQNADEWSRNLARQDIEHTARRKPHGFTSDDLERIADLRPNQVGAAIRTACQAGIIESTGQVIPSTRPSAHGRPVRIWRACPSWLSEQAASR